MTKPIARFGIDFDDDLFICYDALPTDTLNRMHTGLSSDVGLVNLHWNYINKSGITSATVSYTQEFTDYGIRKLHCVTGTNTTDGAYFGRTGSTNDFSVSNATTYTAVFWIKATVGSGTSFTIAMQNSTGSGTFTISSAWQKVTRTFTTTGTTTAFKIAKNTSATNVTFDATGFMIVTGSTAPNGFNTGHATNLYDNITQDVQSINYSLGKGSATDKLIAEGEANLTLDNTSKRYSPEYASSPLFGYMKSQRRFTVDIQNSSGTWSRRWAGWVMNYAPTPGTTRDRTASIKCQQGKFQLDRTRFNQTVTDATTADAIMSRIILRGYTSAVTPLQMVMNRGRLNAGYFVDPAAIMSLDTGISTIPATGEDWVDAPASRVLESLITVDQGFFFIDRTGKAIYYNRDHYVNSGLGLTNTTVSMDTEAVNFQYVNGTGYGNTVRVNYYPEGTRTDIVWQTSTPIILNYTVRGKVIDVKFEYPEGKRLNIRSIAAFGPGGSDSTLTAISGTLDVSSKVEASFKLDGGRGKLTIRNFSRRGLSITVVLRGVIVESYNGAQVVERVDAAGLLGGQITTSISSKLIQEENDALNLADYTLFYNKQNVGQFTSFQLVNKNNALLDKMLTLELGSKVTISEAQTGHSSKAYYVSGMSESWRADNLLSINYQLAPIFRLPSVWVLGTSVLGTSTYLAY